MSEEPTQKAALDYLTALAAEQSGDTSPVRVDTHANIVLLAGDTAYKVKRAVKFPFLDYSTPEKRAEACRREITHNINNAPQIYREAVPIVRAANGTLSLGGKGDPVEWVVIMNRFDQSLQLDQIAAKGPLSNELCDALATMLARAHENAPRHPDASQGFVDELASYVDQNEAAFAEHPDLFPPDEALRLTRQSRNALDRIRSLILNRGAHGHIRLCHGDAHLRNIVLLDGEPVLFDAIEFSDAMATTDTLYDLAFLIMDLWERGQRPAANRIFNRYLDKQAEPERMAQLNEDALCALPFYLMMRAAIRAKIAASAARTQQNERQRQEQEDQARAYFAQAQAFLDPDEPALLAIGGLSGTGKTTLAHALAHRIGRAPGARILRTDVERKKRLGIPETAKAPPEAYTREASDAVYEILERKIAATLAAGHSAIFDAVFAGEADREKISDVASSAEARFCGLWLEAPETVLKDRVSARQADASDATPAVIDLQLGYELGKMAWRRVDAGGDAASTREHAETALGDLIATGKD
ncbi:AAA family ATPase [Roseibium sp.]|uniref:bifunctional aminoglycoside phosphotransferase/ATP-binding protein n=1 Tax=Roseibium sp. TaxID=1936156 RepID=UPI003A97A46C